MTNDYLIVVSVDEDEYARTTGSTDIPAGLLSALKSLEQYGIKVEKLPLKPIYTVTYTAREELESALTSLDINPTQANIDAAELEMDRSAVQDGIYSDALERLGYAVEDMIQNAIFPDK